MKSKFLTFGILMLFIFSFSSFSQDRAQISFEDLVLSAETDMRNIIEARKLAESLDIPHTIYLPEGVFIEAQGIENGRVVYAIYNNLIDIYDNGQTAFYPEIEQRYDLSTARIHWSDRPTQNPDLGYQYTQQNNRDISFVMVIESSNNRIMTFNYSDGSLINSSYIELSNLTTPIEPVLTYTATIIVSGQVSDNIVEFDTLGAFLRTLYGGNTAILDNVRGIELRSGANSVVATVGSGANSSAIPEFDLTTGDYLGNFIAPNTSLMNSPFDIIFRAADCLVAAITSNNIVRYDLNGNHLGNFVSSISFPEQLYETSSGNVLAAGFSAPSGLYIYDANGTQLNFFSAVTGLRGSFQLGNGNYMVTNGSGVYVLDQNTGALVATPVSGVSGRFIREYDLSIVPVELTSFTANVIGGSVQLNWVTATETNNRGFSVERRSVDDNTQTNWQSITFVDGNGTTTQQTSYSYMDNSVNIGKYQYRLKQIDFDGTFAYSDIVEAEVGVPQAFALEQNYPNPFNPTTNVKFSLPVESNVTIKIFNLIGQEVAEAVNGNYAAGSHTISIDGSALSSGLYFYTFNAVGADGKDFTSTKKMLLMK